MAGERKTAAPESVQVGHEVSDVQVGGITWFIVLLTVGVVFVGWLMVAMINSLESREKKAFESRPSPFAADKPKLPPEPRLQLAPSSEEQIENDNPPDLKTQSPLKEMEHQNTIWKDELSHYSWVDESAGVVRIPIDDAKRLLLQRGIPTRNAKQSQ